MEATVRYIPTQISRVDGRDIATGSKPALCFKGKSYALGVINDEEEIHTVTLDLRDFDKLRLLMHGSEEYPVKKFISHMERIMRNKPISSEALRLMKDWPNNPRDFGDEKIQDDVSIVQRKSEVQISQNCIPVIAGEHKTTPQKVRKFLRSKGLSAPYHNEEKIRKLMKDYK